jgi:hypothetical protein
VFETSELMKLCGNLICSPVTGFVERCSSGEHCTRGNEATGLVCDISGSRSSIAQDVTLCRWANGFATFGKLTVVRLLDSEDEGVTDRSKRRELRVQLHSVAFQKTLEVA